jgi:hypothetical protein
MSAPTQAMIERCLRAAIKSGMELAHWEMRPDGALRFVVLNVHDDELTGAEEWFQKDDARSDKGNPQGSSQGK